ncbi:MAG: hypothetical protein WC793_00540 [Candidatus Paceibacterota bacterium]|jgi:hypothetical protein
MILRIFASLVLLFSILFMPIWLSIILAILAMAYFPIFWEAILLLLLSDLLYGIKDTKNFTIIFSSFVLSIILLIVIEITKKKVKYYS